MGYDQTQHSCLYMYFFVAKPLIYLTWEEVCRNSWFLATIRNPLQLKSILLAVTPTRRFGEFWCPVPFFPARQGSSEESLRLTPWLKMPHQECPQPRDKSENDRWTFQNTSFPQHLKTEVLPDSILLTSTWELSSSGRREGGKKREREGEKQSLFGMIW